MNHFEVFENDKIESSTDGKLPTKTGYYLVFGEDKALGKADYILAYFRADTNKFYLHKDCYKKNDLESFWKITPEMWIFLQDVDLSEFTDK